MLCHLGLWHETLHHTIVASFYTLCIHSMHMEPSGRDSSSTSNIQKRLDTMLLDHEFPCPWGNSIHVNGTASGKASQMALVAFASVVILHGLWLFLDFGLDGGHRDSLSCRKVHNGMDLMMKGRRRGSSLSTLHLDRRGRVAVGVEQYVTHQEEHHHDPWCGRLDGSRSHVGTSVDDDQL